MKNKIYKYDFLIIGAGLIGALAALELQKKKYKVLIIEKNQYAFHDRRTLAVNANSRDFLISLGLWGSLKHEPINQIIIKDEKDNQPLEFKDLHEPMGSVIYNSEVLNIARNILKKNKSLIDNFDLPMDELRPHQTIKIKDKVYSFKKIIISVGKKNFLSPQKIKKHAFISDHQSYVGFFNHHNIHENKAYEIFTKNGPLAVLPAPSNHKKLSTFIYSSRLPINQTEIKKLIKKYFSRTHGVLKFGDKFQQFNISPHLSFTRDRNILILGDSLRSIHPVAGQGWNLGVKDIQTLSELLDRYSIEDENLIRLYYSKRKVESLAYLSFTNLINYLYEDQNSINDTVIKIGYKILNQFTAIRKIFIQQAMGRENLV